MWVPHSCCSQMARVLILTLPFTSRAHAALVHSVPQFLLLSHGDDTRAPQSGDISEMFHINGSAEGVHPVKAQQILAIIKCG